MAKGVKKSLISLNKESSKKFPVSQSKSLERTLVENFVALQKVMTNLSARFDELSKQISKLLELFEVSAQALAKKDINFTKPMDEEKIMKKLDSLFEQNKVIARGLSLMHEKAGVIRKPEIHETYKLPPPPVSPPNAVKKNFVQERYQKSPFSEGF